MISERRSPSQRIAHRHLRDPELGTAKSGQIKEVIDLQNQTLISAQYDDGSTMTLDQREISKPRWVSGPAVPILKAPKQLLAVFDLRLPFLALMLAILIGAVIALTVFNLNWQLEAITISVTLLSAYALWMLRILNRRQIIRSQGPKS